MLRHLRSHEEPGEKGKKGKHIKLSFLEIKAMNLSFVLNVIVNHSCFLSTLISLFIHGFKDYSASGVETRLDKNKRAAERPIKIHCICPENKTLDVFRRVKNINSRVVFANQGLPYSFF